jgi:hypothetical protein
MGYLDIVAWIRVTAILGLTRRKAVALGKNIVVSEEEG